MSNEKCEKYIAIFLTLMVCTTRISMAAGHVFMALSSILTLYMLWKNRKSITVDPSIKRIMMAYGIMLLCFIPSVVCSMDFTRSLKVFLDSWIYRTLVFIGIVFCVKSRKYINNMLSVFLTVASIDCLFALYQFTVKHINRAWGFGGGSLAFGGLLIMLFPIALVLVCDENVDAQLKKVAKFNLVAVLLAFFSNQSRSSWLIAAISAPMAIWRYALRSKKLMLACLAVIVCLSGVFVTVPQYRNRLASITNITTDRSNGDRVVVWKTSYIMFKEHPLVGIGPDEFQVLYRQKYRTKEDTQNLTHTHNNFVQIAVEEGCIGLLGFLYFLFAFCKETLKGYFKDKNPYDLLVFLTILDYIVLYGMIEYGMDISSNVRILWFLLAILLQMKMTRDMQKDK